MDSVYVPSIVANYKTTPLRPSSEQAVSITSKSSMTDFLSPFGCIARVRKNTLRRDKQIIWLPNVLRYRTVQLSPSLTAIPIEVTS